ncbi:MAG: hypothetical protein EPN91_02660, partial [Salinibacterium sp.]
DKKVIAIGRPQADQFSGELPYVPDARTVVLYAPTWEGDREAAAYGSIASHGVELTKTLLASGTHRLIYRPHPRSGVLDPAYKKANESIIAAIAKANAADPSAQHIFDESPDLGWQLLTPDVAITDISAMIYDRLATGRPIIVTKPVSEEAEIDEGGFLGSCEWLFASRASDIVSLVEKVQFDSSAQKSLKFWAERHFGDTSPGVATTRFHAAIEQLMQTWNKHNTLHARDPREADSFGSDEDEDPNPE